MSTTAMVIHSFLKCGNYYHRGHHYDGPYGSRANIHSGKEGAMALSGNDNWPLVAGGLSLDRPSGLQLWTLMCWRSGAGPRPAADLRLKSRCCLSSSVFFEERNIRVSVCLSKILTHICFYVTDIPHSTKTLKHYLINYPHLSYYGQTIFCLSFPSRDRATSPGRYEQFYFTEHVPYQKINQGRNQIALDPVQLFCNSFCVQHKMVGDDYPFILQCIVYHKKGTVHHWVIILTHP
jgi:hypothetical protein